MGGVTASWGMLGDVILAEPGAMIGFAGLRVSQQANVAKVPADFQTSEFQTAHGHVDRIVPRKDLKDALSTLFAFAGVTRDPQPDLSARAFADADPGLETHSEP
jgi:acetyl-CoA carboxylase carboxyl transferase subunit beta